MSRLDRSKGVASLSLLDRRLRSLVSTTADSLVVVCQIVVPCTSSKITDFLYVSSQKCLSFCRQQYFYDMIQLWFLQWITLLIFCSQFFLKKSVFIPMESIATYQLMCVRWSRSHLLDCVHVVSSFGAAAKVFDGCLSLSSLRNLLQLDVFQFFSCFVHFRTFFLLLLPRDVSTSNGLQSIQLQLR